MNKFTSKPIFKDKILGWIAMGAKGHSFIQQSKFAVNQ